MGSGSSLLYSVCFFLDLIWMQRICILHFSSQYALLKFIILGFICVVLDVLQWKIAIKNPWVKWKTKGRACSHHWVKKILPLFATYIDFRVLDRRRESVGIKRNSDSRQFRRTVPNFILLHYWDLFPRFQIQGPSMKSPTYLAPK